MDKKDIKIEYVPVEQLKGNEYNPRKWDNETKEQLKESINRFGAVDPILVNSSSKRKDIVIGGNFRLEVLKELGHKTAPVVYLNTPDINKEKELNVRLNKNQGEFDYKLLADFDEDFLGDIGFDSIELDDIFLGDDSEEEQFDINKELAKLNIEKITVNKGDVYDLDGSRLCCGDSTVEEDMKLLMGNAKADFCLTDPPYILDYLNGNTRNGKATEGFGVKKNRRYLETDILPPDFTEKWMGNVSKFQKDNFSIMVYENWKNIRTIWGEMEKHWKVKNMVVWHLPNMAPLGYLNQNRMDQKGKVIVDPQRGPVIKKIFEKVAYEHYSGRKIYNWLRHELNFYTRGNKPITLSGIYRILDSTFYYGEFEYPRESGNVYKGIHEPLINKELFDKAQAQLKRDKIVRESKEFSFTKLFVCGKCGSGISAEEKWKTLKSGGSNRYIYYSCSRARDRNCKNKYIREEELIKQLLNIIDDVSINELGMHKSMEDEVKRFNKFQKNVFGVKEKIKTDEDLNIRKYAKYLLKEGSTSEKRLLLSNLRSRIRYEDKELSLIQ